MREGSLASVEIRNARKTYGDLEVIHGVTVPISDGEFVALVGPSGCGKSTLLRMIAGLEDITGGEIRIGDRVVNGLPPKDRDIAMVFQTYALYPHKTVAENMGFALKLRNTPKPEIEERVKRAAEILDLIPYLNRYPRQLSGGQRQRVAIARVILKNAPILVLDEATSALDSFTEREIQSALDRVSKDRTTLVIAHRLSTVVNAHEIIVLDQGVVAERGTHQQLLSQNGIYAALWNRQRQVAEAEETIKRARDAEGPSVRVSLTEQA